MLLIALPLLGACEDTKTTKATETEEAPVEPTEETPVEPTEEAPVEPTEETPVAEANAIPHEIGGTYENCLMCHSSLSEAHEGKTNDDCQACHAAPEVEETPVEAANPIPADHDLEGIHANCLMCHSSLSGAHEGKTNDDCQTCHAVAQ